MLPWLLRYWCRHVSLHRAHTEPEALLLVCPHKCVRDEMALTLWEQWMMDRLAGQVIYMAAASRQMLA